MRFAFLQSPLFSGLPQRLEVSAQIARTSHWLVAGVCVVSLIGCGKTAPPPVAAASITPVGVLTLATESHPLSLELAGRTSAFLSAEIRPQVGGILRQRLFTEGARVKAGQLLYQIDASSYEVALSAAQAQLAKARAQLAATQNTARRNTELLHIDAISRQQYDDSQTAVLQAQAELQVASAAEKSARINLGYTRIQAPIAGFISASSVTPGALLTANQSAALASVVQTDPLYVDIVQSSNELLQLKSAFAQGRFERLSPDQAKLDIRLDDGSRYPHPGRLQFSGVQVNPSTGAVTLRAVLPNPDGLLMPGMYVRALLQAGVNERALLLPQQAVTRDPAGNAAVLVISAEDKIERRRIQTGAAVGNRWEVLSGVQAGERIVVDGSQRVRPGDSVQPVPWTPKENTPQTPANTAQSSQK